MSINFSSSFDSQISTGVFVSDATQLASIKKVMEQHNFRVDYETQTDGSTAFLQKISINEIASLKAVIVDLKGQEDPFYFVKEICARFSKETAIIGIGPSSESFGSTESPLAFNRKLRALGLSDYFIEPVPYEELAQSLLSFLQADLAAKGHEGTVVTVYGTHGGVGAATISAALSMHLSQIHGRASVAVDTNMLSPAVGTYLGADKSGNLKLLLQAGARIDSALVRQATTSALPQLSFLDGWEDLKNPSVTDNSHVNELVSILGMDYRYQVWLGSGDKSLRVPALTNADIIMIVVTGSLSCAKNAQATLRWLSDIKFTGRTIVVYNNVAPNSAIPKTEMEKVLDLTIDFEVQYSKKLSEDIVKAVPFHSKEHALYSDIQNICNDLLGISQKTESKGLLGRFFK